jgi:hypothetical protein
MAKVRLVAWLGALVGVAGAMLALGGGPLGAPDLRQPSTWSAWAQARTAPDAVMAVLRLVVLGLAVYLLVVTLLAVALRLGDAGRAVSVLDVLTLPFVRSVVNAGLGVGLVGATVAGVSAQPGVSRAPTPADAAIVTVEEAAAPPTIAEEPTTTTTSTSIPDRSRRDVGPPGAPVATGTASAPTWTVAPGDHLWSIAERSLAATAGRAPAEEEVVPYWRALVEANRHVLADPDNPDLLFAGQVLSLPQ